MAEKEGLKANLKEINSELEGATQKSRPYSIGTYARVLKQLSDALYDVPKNLKIAGKVQSQMMAMERDIANKHAKIFDPNDSISKTLHAIEDQITLFNSQANFIHYQKYAKDTGTWGEKVRGINESKDNFKKKLNEFIETQRKKIIIVLQESIAALANSKKEPDVAMQLNQQLYDLVVNPSKLELKNLELESKKLTLDGWKLQRELEQLETDIQITAHAANISIPKPRV